MPATKRGIFHNLKQSEYTISNTEIVFFFSSKLYLNKFMEGYTENRKEFVDKMSKLVDTSLLDMSTLADCVFYETIEKRGFHAWLKGVTINEEDLYRYALRKMIEKKTLDWEHFQKPSIKDRLKLME